MGIKWLHKNDLVLIGFIFLFTFLANYIGYKQAKIRERDITRLNHLGLIANSLEAYKRDYDNYPQSSKDGKIKACIDENTGYILLSDGSFATSKAGKAIRTNLVECDYGKDPLMDKIYLDLIPEDPKSDEGRNFVYYSNGSDYMLLGSYEAREQADYREDLRFFGLMCGNEFCNVVKLSSGAILENLLKEYQNGIVR